jgi:hypothetical protein
MMHNVAEWTAVLANLASGGASWRVLCASRSGFEGGGVEVSCSATACVRTRGCCRREAVRGYSSWRGGVPSPHASTALGMAMRWSGCRRGRRGWSHRADGDRGDRSRRPDITTLFLHGRGVVVRLPFEGSAVLFRGCGAPTIQERAAQCHGVVADHAAQRYTVAGMASPRELAEQCRGMIPRRVVAWLRL